MTLRMTVSRYFTFQSNSVNKFPSEVHWVIEEIGGVFSLQQCRGKYNLACVLISFCYFLCYVVLSVTEHLNRPIYCVAETYTYKLVAVYLSKVKCGLEVQKQADDKSLFSNVI